MTSEQKKSRPLVPLFGIAFSFTLASCLLYLLSKWRPGDRADLGSYELKFPSNLEELKAIASYLQQYKKEHSTYVFFLFCAAYLYKQTFAIPGSVFMNVLAGAIFGIWTGFPLVCLLTGTGATLCYCLSKCFGRALLLHYFPGKVEHLQQKVQDNLDGLFFFLLFLRLFPVSPNWFLNMASPIVGIPVPQFFFSVLLGLTPYNFICCQTGCILSQISSMDELLSFSVLWKLAIAAVVMLIPSLVLKRVRQWRSLAKKE